MKYFIAGYILLLSVRLVWAQDDLLSELQAGQPDQPGYAIQTFKGSRVVNGHSVETKPAGALEFIISHRFGTLNSGSYNLWGLDASTIRLGLEYGITDRLGVAIGRSSYDKSYDSYVKYKALRQSSAFPVTVTLLGSITYLTVKELTIGYHTADKLAFALQPLIAHKFSKAFSLQLAPVWVHKNAVDPAVESHDLIALGAGARVKLTRSVAINAEYYPRLNAHAATPYYDAIGLGFEIETGGHVFYLVFTNTLGMVERRFASETDGDFFDGDIHFGFNITRTFQLAGPRSAKNASGD